MYAVASQCQLLAALHYIAAGMIFAALCFSSAGRPAESEAATAWATGQQQQSSYARTASGQQAAGLALLAV